MLNTQNIKDAVLKLSRVNTVAFTDGFRYFITRLEIERFRHILNLEIDFTHPVTVIAGTNTVGKTSVLLLLACSHREFIRADATKPSTNYRRHTWRDVITFTSHENNSTDYSYKLNWRLANRIMNGFAKRLSTSQAWTGIGKFSSDAKRLNKQIIGRQARLIDLERVVPARNFSKSLLRKVNSSTQNRVSPDIEKAFAYILDLVAIPEIYEIGAHINKTAYLIAKASESYSSYNAASGEETLLNLLKEIIDSPQDSLVLIDEVEACLHPSVQRKLADVILYVSWQAKKQFILTTHSPSLLSSFPQACRKFIDKDNTGAYKLIPKISVAAAFSRMDSRAYPLVNLYCEDDIAEFIIKQALTKISEDIKFFNRLVCVIRSGPANEVKIDYDRHERNFQQMRYKVGYCCVFDGDYQADPLYSSYYGNPTKYSSFVYPYTAPEKFLVNAYLAEYPDERLSAAVLFADHHSIFSEMESLGLASDQKDARNRCWESFVKGPDYQMHYEKMRDFLVDTVRHFSELLD